MWIWEGHGGTRNLFQCGSNEQGEDKKKGLLFKKFHKWKKFFSWKISTNCGCRLKVRAIFHEFLSEDQRKKSSVRKFHKFWLSSQTSCDFSPILKWFLFSMVDFWVTAQRVWFNFWVSSELLRDLNYLKNEVKWQVGGLPSTTALCAVLRELFLKRLSSIFLYLLNRMQWARKI